MTVGVLIISHGKLGEEMLKVAQATLSYCPLRVETLSIEQNSEVEEMDATAEVMCQRLNEGDGVLVLADLFGSTPCNIAVRLLRQPQVEVVSGINLPMLIRVMNYSEMSLQELVTKVFTGGHDGIILCDDPG